MYNNVDELQKHNVEWKKPATKEPILWVHLHEVHKQARLIYMDRDLIRRQSIMHIKMIWAACWRFMHFIAYKLHFKNNNAIELLWGSNNTHKKKKTQKNSVPGSLQAPIMAGFYNSNNPRMVVLFPSPQVSCPGEVGLESQQISSQASRAARYPGVTLGAQVLFLRRS